MIGRSRRTAGLLAAIAAVGLAAPAAAQGAGEGRYVSAAELKAMVAKTTKGLATAPIPTGPGGTVIVARRDKEGDVEVHEHLNDEFVAQTGHATVKVGGKVTGNHQTAPGEWRGGTIAGGQTYQLAPGDVLWIPAGAPHQVTPKGGSFSYLAVKFDAKP
jgi:mannose-6-phosphate isomerase-like protein (cupin superfamily)